MSETRGALIELARELKRRNYHFTAVTPESHRRFFQKNGPIAGSGKKHVPLLLTELFGWNRSVPQCEVDEGLRSLMLKADVWCEQDEFVTSAVRFASVDDQLYIHSSYPTNNADSVFFGPDTYRYIHFIKEKIKRAGTVLDIGCGSGAGGLALARHLWKNGAENHLKKLLLTDINHNALELCRVNSLSQDGVVPLEIFASDLLKNIPETELANIDTVIANPPYIIDEKERVYRHGGGVYGAQISLNIVSAALDSLGAGGQLALYTGASVVDGEDVFKRALQPLFVGRSLKISYKEIDPDIFGEELDLPAYRDVERIAAVGLHIEVLSK
jgi:methylase of polypeptide subunit release factors